MLTRILCSAASAATQLQRPVSAVLVEWYDGMSLSGALHVDLDCWHDDPPDRVSTRPAMRFRFCHQMTHICHSGDVPQ